MRYNQRIPPNSVIPHEWQNSDEGTKCETKILRYKKMESDNLPFPALHSWTT